MSLKQAIAKEEHQHVAMYQYRLSSPLPQLPHGREHNTHTQTHTHKSAQLASTPEVLYRMPLCKNVLLLRIVKLKAIQLKQKQLPFLLTLANMIRQSRHS